MVRQLTALALALGMLLAASTAQASDLRAGSNVPREGSIVPRGGSIIPRVDSIVPRRGSIIPHSPNFVPNPPPERVPRHGDRQRHGRPERHGHQRGVRPGFVIVAPPVVYAAPRECVTQGYWAYQWVPSTYTQSTWVPGGWMPDGTWLEGRYEQHAYASGYYQPYWVPGQTYAC